MFEIFRYEDREVEIIELGEQVLFNAKQVGECLEMGASSVRKNVIEFNDKQKLKITNEMIENSNATLSNFRKLHNTGEIFLTEAGVYKLVFKSRKK